MLTTPETKRIFRVCFDGVRPQAEGDKEQGYNHQFVPTVWGYNRALKKWTVIIPTIPRRCVGGGGQQLQMTGA